MKKPRFDGMVSVAFTPFTCAVKILMAVEVPMCVMPLPPVPQSAPVPVTTPFVSTCKHCCEMPLMPEIVRFVVVALPVIKALPEMVSLADGVLVPIPRKAFVLSQKKFLLFSKIVPLALPTKGTEPIVSVVVAESGGFTVQFVSVGAQPGSKVSPGK